METELGPTSSAVRRRAWRSSITVALATGPLVLALAACGGPMDPGATPATSPSGTPSGVAADDARPSASPGPTEADPLARFDEVNRAVIAADASAGGRAFVDALAEAGFDRSAMQLTSGTTTLGEPADSIQFSVRIGDRCLIGQYGPAAGGYLSAERPGLGTGGCLVGATVPIDG